MEVAIDQSSILVIAGIAILMLVQWAFLRGKSVAFRKKYHPAMSYIGAVGFGLIIILIPFRDAPIYIKLVIISSCVLIAFIDVMKRQICENCGYEANEFAIHGYFKKFKYCPKCGEPYGDNESAKS